MWPDTIEEFFERTPSGTWEDFTAVIRSNVKKVARWKDDKKSSQTKKQRQLRKLHKLLHSKNQFVAEKGDSRVAKVVDAHSALARSHEVLVGGVVGRKRKAEELEEDESHDDEEEEENDDDDEDDDKESDEDDEDAAKDDKENQKHAEDRHHYRKAGIEHPANTTPSKAHGTVGNSSRQNNSTLAPSRQCGTPALKFGFGVCQLSPSKSEMSDVSETSNVSQTEPEGEVVARLRSAIKAQKGKEWVLNGVDLVAAIRKMQKALLRKITDSQATVEVHSEEHLLSCSCLVLTEAKAELWDKAFSNKEWASLRSFFENRVLQQDDTLWSRARIEAKRMIAAKKAGVGFRARVEDDTNLEQGAVGVVLDTLFHNLKAEKPDRTTNEPTWCAKLLLPYFHLLTDPALNWKYDNATNYDNNRPDFFVHDANNRGMACWEVKTQWAGSAAKKKDVGRSIFHSMEHLKIDMHLYSPQSTPVKVCIPFSGNEGTIFELYLHCGVFLAVEVGTWTIPLCLTSGRDAEVATAIATGSAIMSRLTEIRVQMDRYQPRADPARRPSFLPPKTPAVKKPKTTRQL
ncbi:uncharacterized protein EV422DRAFT_538155 [Fimicolochytrium jonesii]|uniref:uncharacterized protein n=1 Tax=Fimicolochytrium jonesii TaxID=1396493 RepID=UPI0022FE530E|nr:uncharacterized protein EV422DRAFT_538155 [Fimicolochytrium jonesii]KAI8818322.1 hypothetical protein EV422DRAFT_538155 [Fimicolochytrium jonesii]